VLGHGSLADVRTRWNSTLDEVLVRAAALGVTDAALIYHAEHPGDPAEPDRRDRPARASGTCGLLWQR